MKKRSQTASISLIIAYLFGWILPSLTKVPEDLKPINTYDQAGMELIMNKLWSKV